MVVCISLLSNILRPVTVAAKKESSNYSESSLGMIFRMSAEGTTTDETSVLTRRKESRKRNLSFHLPAAVPLAPHIRIVQDDSSYISLQGIYEDYCARTGQHKDDPLRLATEKIQQAPEVQNNVTLFRTSKNHNIDRIQKQALIDLKVDILGIIQNNLVPETIVLNVSLYCPFASTSSSNDSSSSSRATSHLQNFGDSARNSRISMQV